ncbi:phosphatase PAP2 family protein [Thermomonospora echinospora]|uniref:phosphatase PAP2 family protein n=1 Tax=Thermomonospora echinospora TaxID=1992 RepID=UPI001F359ABA|nr:phosphatase PAP2 family protein [Thermomonospora echinospora]
MPGSARTASRPWSSRLLAAPPVWRELLLLVLFYSAYTLTRLVLNGGGTAVAFQNAGEILALERALGIDVELSLNEALLEVSWLARAANYFYGTAHFAVTLGIVVWLYRYRPQHYRWLRTALMAATAVALLGFWLYPLAPPRFLPGEGFVDPVQALGSWGLYSGQSAGTLTNQYAAMPSMHAGWALWCGFVLVLLGTQRWVKAVGVLYPLVTVLVILATANHYIVDAVVGVALVLGALALSRALYARRPVLLARRPRTGPAAGSPACERVTCDAPAMPRLVPVPSASVRPGRDAAPPVPPSRSPGEGGDSPVAGDASMTSV